MPDTAAGSSGSRKTRHGAALPAPHCFALLFEPERQELLSILEALEDHRNFRISGAHCFFEPGFRNSVPKEGESDRPSTNSPVSALPVFDDGHGELSNVFFRPGLAPADLSGFMPSPNTPRKVLTGRFREWIHTGCPI